MKRLIIICEGPTERDFCKTVLYPYFQSNNIYIQTPIIKKSKGGIIHWESLKTEVETHLKQNPSTYVTTFFDYYGILPRHKFPSWNEAMQENNKSQRMTLLEDAMKAQIHNDLSSYFIPYIQLHEFESLLFSEKQVFDDNFEPSEFDDYELLEETFRIFKSPEDINDGKTSAPSKRLEKILKNYNSDSRNQKVILGTLLAEEIGLATIRKKCNRFNEWIIKIKEIFI